MRPPGLTDRDLPRKRSLSFPSCKTRLQKGLNPEDYDASKWQAREEALAGTPIARRRLRDLISRYRSVCFDTSRRWTLDASIHGTFNLIST